MNTSTATSMTDYLLVWQVRPLIDHFVRRQDGQWLYSSVDELSGSVEVTSIGCRLDLVEMYARVDFPEVPPSLRRMSVEGVACIEAAYLTRRRSTW